MRTEGGAFLIGNKAQRSELLERLQRRDWGPRHGTTLSQAIVALQGALQQLAALATPQP